VTHPTPSPRTGFAYLDEPRERGKVLALAHRGGARLPELLGLENTFKAFESAVGMGYRYLETDVHATRDGELLAFHDGHLDRVTDRVGRVADLEYAEVATALVGGTEPIPRLVDLLDAFPDARFNVDLKAPGSIEPMVELLVRTGTQDRVCVASFTERVLRAFRARVRAESRVPVATACGIVAATAVAFLPLGGRVPGLVRDTGLAFQVPLRFRERVPVADRRFVERAHSTGRHVHVWTLDDRADIEHALDLGVDGIFTDRTDVLKVVLVERGLWEGAS
jgi:glycerophosphoryl diester phosphodiesterase